MSVVSVHVSDLPIGEALKVLRRPTGGAGVPGLRHVDVAAAAPLRRRSPVPAAQPARVVQIRFWDDSAAAERELEREPADPSASRFCALLEPLRVFGDWPGLPGDLSHSRVTSYDGPVLVLTLGRVRLTQLPRFLRTSKPAERAAVDSADMVWGTAAARPPFVATCSLWRSVDGATRYAYDTAGAPHVRAIEADRASPFHHRSAFVRFRPLQMRGHLDGRNALDAEAVAGMQRSSGGGDAVRSS